MCLNLQLQRRRIRLQYQQAVMDCRQMRRAETDIHHSAMHRHHNTIGNDAGLHGWGYCIGNWGGHHYRQAIGIYGAQYSGITGDSIDIDQVWSGPQVLIKINAQSGCAW